MFIAPFLGIGHWLEMKFEMQGSSNVGNDVSKEADILCGDTIINYKTI